MPTTVRTTLTYYLILLYLLKDKYITPPPMFSWEICEFFRSSHRRCFMKKAVLRKAVRNFHRKPVTEAQTQMFSTKYCKILKSTYFEEHMLMAVIKQR